MALLCQAEPALKSPVLDKSNEENTACVINFDWAFRLHMATDLLGTGMRESTFSETKWQISIGHANSYSTQVVGSIIHRTGGHQSYLVLGYGSATLHSNTCLNAMRFQVFQHLRMLNVTRVGKSIQPVLNGKNDPGVTKMIFYRDSEWEQFDWQTGTKVAELTPPRKARLWVNVMGGQSREAKVIKGHEADR